MSRRTRIVVERVEVTPFQVRGDGPFLFDAPATITIWLRRVFADGSEIRARLVIKIETGYVTDGASVIWPFSYLVPKWRRKDDEYNAAPTAHDVLYMFQGVVLDISSPNEPVMLSREEVDDILRGIWRCWGMSRFLAGCADKAVELFAGGKSHWGNDGYEVADLVSVSWEPEGA